MSAEYREYPCQETASAPTTKYSTSFELKHSTNSRKSLLRGIVVGSCPDGEEYVDAFLRAQIVSGNRICRVSIFKAVEFANDLFHTFHFTARRSGRNSYSIPPTLRMYTADRANSAVNLNNRPLAHTAPVTTPASLGKSCDCRAGAINLAATGF